MPTQTEKPQTYQGHRLTELGPNDPLIDLTRIYNMPVLVTEPVMRTIDAHSPTLADKDRIMWEMTYMSAMNRGDLERNLSVFRCEVGGEWRSYYAETVQGVIVISRAN